MIKGLILAGAAWFGYRWWSDRQTSGGAPADGKYEFVSGYVGGAQAGDDVPVVVLLHGQSSTPQEAIDRVPITRPARVLVPRGLVAEGGDRYSFFNRDLTGAVRDAAIYEASTALGQAVADIVEAKDYGVTKTATPKRAVVVGLDVSGPLAVATALRNPLQVRQAWATGGTDIPGTWLPNQLPQMNNLGKPIIKKISYGSSGEIDESTAKKANDLGFSYEVLYASGPDGAKILWDDKLFPQLEEQLTAP